MTIYIEGKPVNLSPWARWVAMDSNGYCFEYAHRPRLGVRVFIIQSTCTLRYLGSVRDPSKYDWRKTRTEVPR